MRPNSVLRDDLLQFIVEVKQQVESPSEEFEQAGLIAGIGQGPDRAEIQGCQQGK
jgi:hypothetical protein